MPEERQARAEARQIDDGGDRQGGETALAAFAWGERRGTDERGENSNAVQNGPQGRRETNAVGVRVGRTPEGAQVVQTKEDRSWRSAAHEMATGYQKVSGSSGA